ncbi:Sulfatase [Anaerovirgula multivorans]|uniref:Sulfatase n=1 Tax=Anaerovirgula multivorans TaxID=312168 RepID=A0A239L3M9_9FIRM|nr:STM4013/SEN3800 family hydrolase [Anaerovirgula multivorans]SNT24920.1 Sulfatase [Anaerovirgula multivorans]
MTKISNEVPKKVIGDVKNAKYSVNMNQIVGEYDILFVCLDTLRYDVAYQEQENNNTPVLNRYGKWRKCHAPGNYTFPSHMAMFVGSLPSPAEPIPLFERERLFMPKEFSSSMATPKSAFLFEGSSFIEGLEKVEYETLCIGGVGFFNKRTEINRILPNLFKYSYWHPSFSCHIKESFENQLNVIEKKLDKYSSDQRIFMYVNIDSIHYPNNFYLEGEREDNVHTHAAALRYVDSHIDRLFDMFKKRGKTFVIVCSDHGSCYGEDGYNFHCLSHEIVYTVPYKHFFLGDYANEL